MLQIVCGTAAFKPTFRNRREKPNEEGFFLTMNLVSILLSINPKGCLENTPPNSTLAKSHRLDIFVAEGVSPRNKVEIPKATEWRHSNVALKCRHSVA